MRSPTWQIPTKEIVLTTKDVHIWRGSLDLAAAKIEKLFDILSQDEKLRAQRFRFPEHQKRFIAARGILRQLLSTYLDLPAKSIVFEYSDRGKPTLAKSINYNDLQFNLSHSQDLAVYGFTLSRKIGIDLEYLKPLTDAKAIASRFFAATEKELICSLTGEEQQQVFFQLWTAKEAYLKAIGEGITGSLAEVEIALASDRSITSFKLKGNTITTESWLLSDFIPETNYLATVAVESLNQSNRINFWTWE
jgi:4'-phosphopantetheinyl transferase